MMRSFDQYGNVMLEDTFERHVVGNVYADERVRALLSVLVLSVSGSAKGPGNACDKCLAVAACCLNISGRMQYFSDQATRVCQIASPGLTREHKNPQVGLYVIRGENLVLLGDLDMDKEAQVFFPRAVMLSFLSQSRKAILLLYHWVETGAHVAFRPTQP